MSKNRSLLKTVNKKRINYLYLLPFSIAFFTFTVLPVLYSIFLGFCNYNVLEPPVLYSVIALFISFAYSVGTKTCTLLRLLSATRISSPL